MQRKAGLRILPLTLLVWVNLILLPTSLLRVVAVADMPVVAAVELADF
jgi:hypothetical protein